MGRFERLELTDEQWAVVPNAIEHLDRYWRKPNGELIWKADLEHCLRLNLLPLYFGWTAVTVLQLDGEILGVDTEWEPWKRGLHIDLAWRMHALQSAAKRYPELYFLKPNRPDDAVVCKECNGSGINPINERLGNQGMPIGCQCAGRGWRLPEESNKFPWPQTDENSIIFPDPPQSETKVEPDRMVRPRRLHALFERAKGWLTMKRVERHCPKEQCLSPSRD